MAKKKKKTTSKKSSRKKAVARKPVAKKKTAKKKTAKKKRDSRPGLFDDAYRHEVIANEKVLRAIESRLSAIERSINILAAGMEKLINDLARPKNAVNEETNSVKPALDVPQITHSTPVPESDRFETHSFDSQNDSQNDAQMELFEGPDIATPNKTKPFTQKEITDKLMEVSGKVGMPRVKAILKEFDAAKVSELPESVYGQVARKCESVLTE